MKSSSFGLRNVTYLFAFITMIAYGLVLPQTGFYWDDWPFAWIAKFLGPQEFFRAFEGVRPFLGPIFFVTTSLIPPVPIYWQLFALIIRLLSGLSAWFAMNQIWPQFRRQTLIVSLLFLVYPGYSQHWVAFTHINQEWIPLIFYLLSFGFTATAVRNQPKYLAYTVYALLLLAAGIFPTEYFVGLEPLRFLFIWVIASEGHIGFKPRFNRTLRIWLPYLLVWLVNIVWLVYFYTIGNYDSYGVELVTSPVNILRIVSAFGETLWKGGVFPWIQVLLLLSKSLDTPVLLLTLTLIAANFIILSIYFGRYHQTDGELMTFARFAILIGFTGLFLGRLPSFAAGLPLTLQSSNDRFMISMMLCGALFIVGVIEVLVVNIRVKDYLFALLIALSIGQQFFNANLFRRDWSKQQEIFWQLAWRIPAMKPRTTLLTSVLPVDYESDLSFTAPINWIYSPDHTHSELDYSMIFTEIRLGLPSLPVLERDRAITVGMRGAEFHGSTSQVIVIYMPVQGCLRVLDPKRGDQDTYGKQSRLLVEAIPLSDPTNIIYGGSETAKLPFLSEPVHTWCYFYAKAELAYQRQDWKQVVALIDEANSLGYYPDDPFEWLAYIEAQASTGNTGLAQRVSEEALLQENSIRKGLCAIWKRVQVESPVRDEKDDPIDQVLVKFRCVK